MRLTERYRLVDLLEDDGTREVWRAWDELLGRPVAVKLLASARTDLHRAFQKGVNRAAGLSHAALETVYDSDQTRDVSGRLVSYVVTEFLSGETLAERLRLGPLSASETAGICAQVAGALRTAHRAGVPHGDLTTGEIVLFCGDVKVVDTGLAGIVRGARGTSGHDRTPGTAESAVAEAKASDVRALGAVIAACLPAGPPADLAALAARCASATAEHGPSMNEIAALLTREDEPPNAVFSTVRRAPSPEDRTRTLRPIARPRRYGRHARLAALALVIAIPATAAAAMLVSAPRAPVTVVPAPSQPRADGPPAPAPPAARGGRATETGVTDALGRLRPIVSRGYSSGEIRSDVAIDLNNVITNLEDDLTSDRAVDVAQRIGLLREKIVTRERERGLSPGLADELDRVLATVQT